MKKRKRLEIYSRQQALNMLLDACISAHDELTSGFMQPDGGALATKLCEAIKAGSVFVKGPKRPF